VKKDSTATKTARRAALARVQKLTIGMDLGDRVSRYCILNEEATFSRKAACPLPRVE